MVKKENIKIYNRYYQMIRRCYDKKQKAYELYGARGITVCESWRGKNGFSNFIRDMGVAPDGHWLERIDNDKGYSKENCKWATTAEQSINKRRRKNKHGFTGIKQAYNKWAAVIRVNKKDIYLGCFKTKKEAAMEYDKASEKYHGSFGWKNFPNG